MDRGGDGAPHREPETPAFLADLEPLVIFGPRGEDLVPLGDDDLICINPIEILTEFVKSMVSSRFKLILLPLSWVNRVDCKRDATIISSLRKLQAMEEIAVKQLRVALKVTKKFPKSGSFGGRSWNESKGAWLSSLFPHHQTA
jgi:hypothetical protein